MTITNTDVSAPESQEDICTPIRNTLSRVGDKWSMQIICRLSGGALRFNALGREVEGISQRMLTLKLRDLERDGLVSRRVEETVPPSVYYDLTPLGQTLIEPAHALVQWVIDNQQAVALAQQAYDNSKPPKPTR